MPSEKFKAFIEHIKPIVEKHKDGLRLNAEKLTLKSSKSDCLVCGQQIGSNSCSMQH
jgi:hypothetical protein